jgi:pimeloyl-ACP methyl ester carboxylesterase
MADELPHVDGVEHRYIEVNGTRIHVAEAGPGDSPAAPILLLHGWPQHWYMWRRVIQGLRAERRLLAPDLRGFGWSDAPGHGYDGETFAADQIGLLDALGIERAHVLGHDWGGWTAMLLAVLHPNRAIRVINCNAPHPFVRPTPSLLAEAWRSWYTWLLAAPGLGRRVLQQGWITRNVLSHGNVVEPFEREEVEIYFERFGDPERADAAAKLYRYYQRAFLEGLTGRWRGARLTVPTLLLFGERDRYISPRLVRGDVPDNMRVELVADSGHFLVNERPDLVIARAREFLSWPAS